jgi:hypothetical protein
MAKRNKIIYWVATIWLSFGMLSSGIIQLSQYHEEVEHMALMGYQGYFLMILGVWKILGVITIMIPKFPLVKEWAYAGFFFVMSGAAMSHIATKHSFKEMFPSLLFIILIFVSWYFRPANRKLKFTN